MDVKVVVIDERRVRRDEVSGGEGKETETNIQLCTQSWNDGLL